MDSCTNQKNLSDKKSSTTPMSPPLSPKSSTTTTTTTTNTSAKKSSFKIPDIINNLINSNYSRSGNGNDNNNDDNIDNKNNTNHHHQQQRQLSPPYQHQYIYENGVRPYTTTTTTDKNLTSIITNMSHGTSPADNTFNNKISPITPTTTTTNLLSSESAIYHINCNTNSSKNKNANKNVIEITTANTHTNNNIINNNDFPTTPLQYSANGGGNSYDCYSYDDNSHNSNYAYNNSSIDGINHDAKKSRMDINFILDNNNNDTATKNDNDIGNNDDNDNDNNDNEDNNNSYFNNNGTYSSQIGGNNYYYNNCKNKNKYNFNSSPNGFRLPSINEISHFDHNQEQMYLGGGSGDGSDVNRIRKTSHKNKRLNDEDSDNYHHQTIKSSKKVKRSGTSSSSSQRKGKGNSLARVMADRGLLRTSFNADITAAEIKSVRIPPPPSLSFDELMLRINQLQLDTRVLDNTQPSITWKGHPLQIEHLPHYNVLHPTESHVVSVLRLTPIQYLTGKHTLISSARRYTEKDLPFKKSDAQKLLRIDVNKASKLWDFFHQMNWIQL